MELDLISFSDGKTYLRKDSAKTDDDLIIRGMITESSEIVKDRVNNAVRNRQYAEYIDETDMPFLKTRFYPINSITSITPDTSNIPRTYPSADALDADDYMIRSEFGHIWVRDFDNFYNYYNGYGCNRYYRHGHTIKKWEVIYTAGLQSYEIIPNVNDYIEWEDANGLHSAQLQTKNDSLSVRYTSKYTAQELASHIQTQMRAVTGKETGTTISVSFDEQEGKFTISQDTGTFILRLFNGDYVGRSVGRTLGFDAYTSTDTNLNPHQYNQWVIDAGTVGTTSTEIDAGQTMGRVNIENRDESKNLFYNFDDGSDFSKIEPFDKVDDLVPMSGQDTIYLKGSAAGTNYQVTYSIQSSSLSWTSDFAVFGVPADLQTATKQILALLWRSSGREKNIDLGLKSKSTDHETVTFNPDAQEEILQKYVDKYRKRNV